ncbi:unnamed protein product [Cuscuta campestris]|uniref:Uncharacterized protein n=1 Tax=Cuscuta campestris TaxID=132261 RepID=A0A484KZ76_9ASTE|nr:unnamed protein product [Cuscuta campestris]
MIRLLHAGPHRHPPIQLDRGCLVDIDLWREELRRNVANPRNVYQVLESVTDPNPHPHPHAPRGFPLWNGIHESLIWIDFIDKQRDEDSMGVDAVRELLGRFGSVVGVIEITDNYKKKKIGFYVHKEGSTHLGMHTVVLYGEYLATEEDEVPPGVYWMFQDSHGPSTGNPRAEFKVSWQLLKEAYVGLPRWPNVLAPPPRPVLQGEGEGEGELQS